MLWIIGLVMLWFRPSWGFLGIFALGLAVLRALISYFAVSALPDFAGQPLLIAFAIAVDVAINVGIFAVLGAIVVAIRGGKIERNPSEKEIDAELARFRAEAAARDQQPPPPAN